MEVTTAEESELESDGSVKLTEKDLEEVSKGKISEGLANCLFESLRTGFLKGLHKEMEAVNEKLESSKSVYRLAGFLDKAADGQALTLWLVLKKDGESVRDLVKDLDENLEKSGYAERGISLLIKAKLLPADAVPASKPDAANGLNFRTGSLSAKLLSEKVKEKPESNAVPEKVTDKPASREGEKRASLIESDHEAIYFLAQIGSDLKNEHGSPKLPPGDSKRPLQLKDYSKSSPWLIDLYHQASKSVDETVRGIARPKK